MSTFLPSLKQKGHLDSLHINLCCVGSRKSYDNDDYAAKGWEIFAPNLTIYGIDADADACENANQDLLNRSINWQEKHIPIAIADQEGEKTLYVTKAPMCSSLYPPNETYLSRFQKLPELSSLDFEFELETTTLDGFCQAENLDKIDFLQIDVQGAELQVLQGGQQILSTVLAVQVEVEFSHLYLNQPLFADIDIALRNQGFTLFDIQCSHQLRDGSPIFSSLHPGQLLWGDAFYFRDLLSENIDPQLKTPANIFKLACLADALEFTDYSLELLQYLTIHFGEDSQYNFAHLIIQRLSQVPDLFNQDFENLSIIQKMGKYITEETPTLPPQNPPFLAHPSPTETLSSQVLLHVGCGAYDPHQLPQIFQHPQWKQIRLDIDPHVNPDIIGSITDMKSVFDESVDAIYSSHNLEHIYAHQVPQALGEFLRVLKPGGFVIITLPDLQKVAESVAQGNLEETLYLSPAGPITPLDILYGLRSAIKEGQESMAHRTGFTAKTLRKKMENAGFSPVEITHDGLNLWATGYKI